MVAFLRYPKRYDAEFLRFRIRSLEAELHEQQRQQQRTIAALEAARAQLQAVTITTRAALDLG